LSKKRVLVTGCAGFIGSHIAETLINRGYNVIGIDCFTPYYSIKLKQHNMKNIMKSRKFNFIKMNLAKASINEISSVLKGIDYVIHEAAQPGVRNSWGENFGIYVENNIIATQKLLEASLRSKVKKIIYASSSSIYGNVKDVPIKEDIIPRPYSPYGVTKIAAENLCRAYYENYSLPVVILRYFTVYGPRQRPDMAFHKFIKAMLKNELVKIYGDGSQMRDFTYVDDDVEATILAMELDDDALLGEAINVGSSRPVKLLDAVKMISGIVGVEPQIVFSEPRKGDVKVTYANISKARKLLGWKPRTDFRYGLERQVEWMRELISIGLI